LAIVRTRYPAGVAPWASRCPFPNAASARDGLVKLRDHRVLRLDQRVALLLDLDGSVDGDHEPIVK
jgi:hypothetical protein